MDSVEIIRVMSEETFADVVNTSPRKVRETLYARMGIKGKKKKVGLRVHAKAQDRANKLLERLKNADSDKELELCTELLRNWLYHQRPMLKATLDFLDIPNDNGLTEQDTDFFESLQEEQVKNLVSHLTGNGFALEHVSTYLHFVSVPHLDGALT
jgi:hypothetical protein